MNVKVQPLLAVEINGGGRAGKNDKSGKKWASHEAHFCKGMAGHVWSSSAMTLRTEGSSRICLLSAMPTRRAVVQRRLISQGVNTSSIGI